MSWSGLVHWLDRHRELEARAMAVWEAIPEPETAFHGAREALDLALRLHMDQEDAWLLPRWADVPDPPPNATAAVLSAEHQRLRALLAELATASGPVARATASATLLDVLHHHDRREAASVKPGLEARLAPGELRRWLDGVAKAEAALPPRPVPRLGSRGARVADPCLALATDAPLDGLWAPEPESTHPKAAGLRRALLAVVARASVEPEPGARRARLLEAWNLWRLDRIVAAT